MLRVDYRINHDAFASHCSDYIPQDKSIPSAEPIYEVSMSQTLQGGKQRLDFECPNRRFQIHALPIYTAENDVEPPDGGGSVVAILKPLTQAQVSKNNVNFRFNQDTPGRPSSRH